MRNLKKKGFTIVELVIVIAVIAVLAAVLIPTFSNLIKKANESADIQLVRQMNTILQQDEALNGKPADIDGVKAVLAANGISNPTPAYADSAFAWDSEENVIILVNKETEKGVFPKEYEDVDFKDTWEMLDGTEKVILGADSDLNQALQNVELGQIIVLSSDQTLNVDSLPKNLKIDLNEQTLTLNNGLPMEGYSNITLSNGTIKSPQISLNDGATLTLNNVIIDSSSRIALYPSGLGSTLNINGGQILADCGIGTAYSDKTNRAIKINISEVTFGTEDNPCDVGLFMITSGEIAISGCTIYASNKGIYNRSGNITIKDTVINYKPTEDFNDTHLNHIYGGNPNPSFGSYPTPLMSYDGTMKHPKGQHWDGGSDGVDAPIVVGDFHAKSYSFDANCTLINVTVNSTNNTYPDVYLSQENYDLIPTGTTTVIPGTEQLVKTTLTCDNSISWYVNPNKNTTFKDSCFDEYEIFGLYGGFAYSGSGYGGTALLYVDNVYVNGVEQAPGSTSDNNIVAGNLSVNIPSFVGTFAAGEYDLSELNVNYPSNAETYDYTAEVIEALKADCGLELTKEELISATLEFGSTPNYLKFVTYTKDGVTKKQTVKGNVATNRLAISAIAHLGLTGNHSGSELVKTNDPVSYYEIFKIVCEVRGITLTENSKIVVGANNTIIGVK